MSVKPIPIKGSQTVAKWNVLNHNGKRPEIYTDYRVCVVYGDAYEIISGYVNDDGLWFIPSYDQKIRGSVVAWAELDASTNSLARIAADEWRLWL